MPKIIRRGIIYKINHIDILKGGHYKNFVALSNCIIFSPRLDTIVDASNRAITIICDFLITFDNKLRLWDESILQNRQLSTMFDENSCTFGRLGKKDINLIVDLFKQRNKYFELSVYLRGTKYRYNRKLDKIIEMCQLPLPKGRGLP